MLTLKWLENDPEDNLISIFQAFSSVNGKWEQSGMDLPAILTNENAIESIEWV